MSLKNKKLLMVLVIASVMISMLFQQRYPRPLAPAGYFLAVIAEVLPDASGLHDTVVLVRQDEAVDGAIPRKALLLRVGGTEGASIAMDLAKQNFSRPLTVDLLFRVLNRLGLEVQGAFIHSSQADAAFARLELGGRFGAMSFDCRPADALAIATRASAPIWMEEKLFERAAADLKAIHHKVRSRVAAKQNSI